MRAKDERGVVAERKDGPVQKFMIHQLASVPVGISRLGTAEERNVEMWKRGNDGVEADSRFKRDTGWAWHGRTRIQ
jgi:hypothetical protein